MDILSLAEGARAVGEPDNPLLNPAALEVRRARGWHPLIEVGESAPDYQRVWDLAFAGGWPTHGAVRLVGRAVRRLPDPLVHPLARGLAPVVTRLRPTPDHVVAKSVYSTFTVEWIAHHYLPKVVVLERQLLNVVGSWLELDIQVGDLDRGVAAARMSSVLDVPPPMPEAEHHLRVAWCVGFLSAAMKHTASRHSDWLRLSHEQLIANPLQEFSGLFTALGLRWTAQAERRVIESNRPGRGYELSRVRSELPQAWRRRLSTAQAADVTAVLAAFPALSGALTPSA